MLHRDIFLRRWVSLLPDDVSEAWEAGPVRSFTPRPHRVVGHESRFLEPDGTLELNDSGEETEA